MTLEYPTGPKSEWARQAKAIADGAIPTTPADIPRLLEWLQDMNWPGADTIAGHLRSLGNATVEPIRRVLASGDHIWIRWVLLELADGLRRDDWMRLHDELDHVASEPDAEGAHIEALYLLAKNELETRATIDARVELFRAASGLPGADYRKITSWR